MPNALANALAAEIDKRDTAHQHLEILDTLIHELLELTKPVRSMDEDCNCGKRQAEAGKPRST